MTDKDKQYLIAEIERLKDCASPIVICDTLLSFIDSMQEEPVSKQKLSNVERTVKNWKEEPVNKDFEMALAEMIDKAQKCVVEPLVVAEQWKDELIKLAKSEEPVSDEQVKKSTKNQHIDKTCKENGNSLTQELVSESIDFEQELYKAFGQIKDFTLGVAIAKRFYDMGRKHNEPVSEELEKEIENFLDYSNLLAPIKEVEFIACYFTNWQKEQMMANATKVTVHIDAGGYPYIPQMELYDYDKDIPLAKEGDRYKVILIKEK